MNSSSATSNRPATKTLLYISHYSSSIWNSGPPPRGPGLLRSVNLEPWFSWHCVDLWMGSEWAGREMWHVPGIVFVQIHTVHLFTAGPSLGTTAPWRIHTQHKDPIMSLHTEAWGGGRLEMDNGCLSISDVSKMASFHTYSFWSSEK